MLTWNDIIKIAQNGNLPPDRRVEKTDEQWKEQLTDIQYEITRKKGTERPYSSELCNSFDPGVYECVCCGTELFSALEQFKSGTGWPSFTQPIQDNAIAYKKDTSHGMVRVEVLCNTCDAHLGHVFPDGPEPSGIRFCINAIALNKKVGDQGKKIVLGGGCFWCTEAVFEQIKGVQNVVNGYSGGDVPNPTYKEVCSGKTGHAEVVEITYDPNIISFKQLVQIHMTTHDPTSLNRQGPDEGTQYRSIIFYANEDEKNSIETVFSEMQPLFPNPIVTQVEKEQPFYEAEAEHQDFYRRNPSNGYCQVMINPKLQKLKKELVGFIV